MANDKNIHQGHRARMRQKYIEHGIESLAEHEVLELLLYYVIPRGNTNEAAHRLLSHFGSLSNVFETDTATLMQVEGIGEAAAAFIHLQADMCRLYYRNKKNIDRMQLTPENSGDLIRRLFYGYTNERFFMISLDGQNRVIKSDMICEGTINNVHIDTRDIINRALNLKAKKVIFAHNHPNGVLLPSEEDRKTTRLLIQALSFINVSVADHLIVAHDEYYSMRKETKIFQK